MSDFNRRQLKMAQDKLQLIIDMLDEPKPNILNASTQMAAALQDMQALAQRNPSWCYTKEKTE